MVRHLYKVLGVGLVLYALIMGLITELPVMGSLGQSNRNIFYHVPTWFAVIVMMGVSVMSSIRYLRMTDPDFETINAVGTRSFSIFNSTMGKSPEIE